MNKLFRIPAVVLLAMFVFGCGQSGPLYVSGNPSTIQPSAEQVEAEEEDDSESTGSDSE